MKWIVTIMFLAVASTASAQTPAPSTAPEPAPTFAEKVQGNLEGHEVRIADLESRIGGLKAKASVAKAGSPEANGLRRQLKAAQAELAQARDALAKAYAEVRKAETAATVTIVQAQLGQTVVINPPAPLNPAAPAPVALPTVHSDRCKGRMVSATAGAMYTYYECFPEEGPEPSLTEPAQPDKPKRVTLKECALWGLVGAVGGAGLAQIAPATSDHYGWRVGGKDYGIAAAVGAPVGYLTAFAICAAAR